ncbi:MAG: hypothetical protein ACJ8F3_17550 [Xanthobacteraceae bacterium]
MLLITLLILYLLCCWITGYVGRFRRMGMLGTFLLSILITPLLMLLLLVMTGPSQGVEWRPKRD